MLKNQFPLAVGRAHQCFNWPNSSEVSVDERECLWVSSRSPRLFLEFALARGKIAEMACFADPSAAGPACGVDCDPKTRRAERAAWRSRSSGLSRPAKPIPASAGCFLRRRQICRCAPTICLVLKGICSTGHQSAYIARVERGLHLPHLESRIEHAHFVLLQPHFTRRRRSSSRRCSLLSAATRKKSRGSAKRCPPISPVSPVTPSTTAGRALPAGA